MYSTVLLLVILFTFWGAFEQRLQARRVYFVVTGALILIEMWFLLRESGVDTPAYIEIFQTIESIASRMQIRNEWIFYGVAYWLRSAALEPIQILLLFRSVYVFLCLSAAWSVSRIINPRASLFLLALIISSHIFFLESINTIRFGIANALMLHCYSALWNNRLAKCFLIAGVASLIHFSAIAMMLALVPAIFSRSLLLLVVFFLTVFLGGMQYSRDLLDLPYANRDDENSFLILSGYAILFVLLYVSTVSLKVPKNYGRLIRLIGYTLCFCFLLIPAPLGLDRFLHYLFFQVLILGGFVLSRFKNQEMIKVVVAVALIAFNISIQFHPSIQRNSVVRGAISKVDTKKAYSGL